MEKSFKNYLTLFWTWFKIGLFTFGGGYAMIALIQTEICEKRKWLTDAQLTEIIAVSEATPGPIAINCATYVGYKTMGFWGSFFATIGVVIPAFTVIFLISLFFNNLLQIEIIANAFKGIKAGVAMLIILAGLKLFKSVKKTPLSITLFSFSFLVTLAISIFSINFSTLYLILIGGIIGLFTTLIFNTKKGNIKTIYERKNNDINSDTKEKTDSTDNADNTNNEESL